MTSTSCQGNIKSTKSQSPWFSQSNTRLFFQSKAGVQTFGFSFSYLEFSYVHSFSQVNLTIRHSFPTSSFLLLRLELRLALNLGAPCFCLQDTGISYAGGPHTSSPFSILLLIFIFKYFPLDNSFNEKQDKKKSQNQWSQYQCPIREYQCRKEH